MKIDLASFKELYPFEPHYVEIDGHQVHYVDQGEGEIMVMVHGNPTWSFYFRNLIQHFSRNYRTIVPDHIGFGLSDKPQEYDYTLEGHIDYFEKFMEKVGAENITLIIHDWGGVIGMGYAVRHPENIKRLVILNTGAFPIPLHYQLPWQLYMCQIPVLSDLIVRGLNGFVRQAVPLSITRKERRTAQVKAGYMAPYNSYANRIAVLKFVQSIPLSPEHKTQKILKELEQNLKQFEKLPIIIIWGKKDFVFNEVILARWKEIYPEAEVKFIHDAGHYVLEDAHERIIPWIEQFLISNPLN